MNQGQDGDYIEVISMRSFDPSSNRAEALHLTQALQLSSWEEVAAVAISEMAVFTRGRGTRGSLHSALTTVGCRAYLQVEVQMFWVIFSSWLLFPQQVRRSVPE